MPAPLPVSWAMTPSNSLVVASPKILGPTTVKTVEAMAKMTATTSDSR